MADEKNIREEVRDEEDLWSIVDLAVRKTKFPNRFHVAIGRLEGAYQADITFSPNKQRPVPHRQGTPFLYLRYDPKEHRIYDVEIHVGSLIGGFDEPLLSICDELAQLLQAPSVQLRTTDIRKDIAEKNGYRDNTKTYSWQPAQRPESD